MVNLKLRNSSKNAVDNEYIQELINEALRDQQANFNAQVRGLFNIIMIMNKQIEALERKSDKKIPAGTGRKLTPKIKMEQSLPHIGGCSQFHRSKSFSQSWR